MNELTQPLHGMRRLQAFSGLGGPLVPFRPAGGAALAVCLLTLAGAGGNPADVGRGDGTAPQTRSTPARTDAVPIRTQLALHTGETLEGTVLNPNFTWRTGYARLTVETRWLREIRVEDDDQGLSRITTALGDRFTGFIEDAEFRLRSNDGPPTGVRLDRVVRAVFENREAGRPSAKTWVVLRNGDMFSGRITPDPLTLETPSGDRFAVALDEIGFASLTGADTPRIALRRRDGGMLEGGLGFEEFHVDLAVGGHIDLYWRRLRMIDCRERLASDDTPDRRGAGIAPETELVWIPPGEFPMGSPLREPERDLDEGPQTKVVIPHGFWIGKTEVTQAEYESVTGTNPSLYTEGMDHPVEKVSWHEAVDFCRELTRLHRNTGRIPSDWEYRLPTEAEWEYACRAGTVERFSHGADPDGRELSAYAWCSENADSQTHPVARKRPNPWGLYDMHGNVWEWCLDDWTDLYSGAVVTNRIAPSTARLAIARGGSWLYAGRHCRSANRDSYSRSNRCSDVGFRIALAPVAP